MRNQRNNRRSFFSQGKKGFINTPNVFEEVVTVTPIANHAYSEGKEAMLTGVPFNKNPYPDFDPAELNTVWTARDCWQMGWNESYNEHLQETR